MLVFDQLKKDDAQLRFLAMLVLSGMLILLGGLWWVQIVSTRYYREKLEVQSTRTVRMPAVRGKILDRNGEPLAENRPSYSIDLYLEELSRQFQAAFARALARVSANFSRQRDLREAELHRKLTPAERKQFAVSETLRSQLAQQTRYEVASNLVSQLGEHLGQAIDMPQTNFDKWYARSRALPMPILASMNPAQVARFEEQSASSPGVDLEVQSTRIYPNNSTAAHIIGYLTRNNDSQEGEPKDYNYRLNDYRGEFGIERLYNPQLRGYAGSKSVLVNNFGYRQSETTWNPAEPGQDIQLTIDLEIQKAAEAGLQVNARGAVLVMNPQNGDILAMASHPAFNPNHFISRPDPATVERERALWEDPLLRPQINRACQQNYEPGSIFKIVVGMAALEMGVLNPKEIYRSAGSYPLPGRRPFKDTAPPGDYDFDSALAQSSNTYFIEQGLKPGVLRKIITLGQRLHLGETASLLPGQEAHGHFPDQKKISANWHDGDTANLSVGQGCIDVTLVQMGIMTSAVANGGKVFWPRLVSRIGASTGDNGGQDEQVFPAGRVRDNLDVSLNTLRIVREAMLADVETSRGTGTRAAVPGFHIAGKTGTAQIQKGDKIVDHTVWFVGFAPYENPRYVVVAMVESGSSGGLNCAPIANRIYSAIAERERRGAAKLASIAPPK